MSPRRAGTADASRSFATPGQTSFVQDDGYGVILSARSKLDPGRIYSPLKRW